MSSRSVRIETYCRDSFIESRAAPPPLAWLSDYYNGLLASCGLEMAPERLENAKNNDFLSMATQVMQSLQIQCSFEDVGLFLMAHQTLDTHYPFRSTTTLLCREFGIEASAIALTEQELTSPYIALMILLAAVRQDSENAAGLLLVLDQATLPYAPSWNSTHSIDNALVIKLSMSPDCSGASVDCRRFWAADTSNKSLWLLRCIHAYLDSQRLELADVHLVVEENLDALWIADRPSALRVADGRYMSCGGLLAVLDLLKAGEPHVLLAHLSADDHLYLFLFRDSESHSQHGSAACSI